MSDQLVLEPVLEPQAEVAPLPQCTDCLFYSLSANGQSYCDFPLSSYNQQGYHVLNSLTACRLFVKRAV